MDKSWLEIGIPIHSQDLSSERQDGRSPSTFGQSSQSKQQELAQRIDQLIVELGARKFSVRQNASRSLWEIGSQAESKLRVAASSKNAEVAARAESILADFEYGIYPTTDRTTKALIISFRDGDLNQKKATGKKLLSAGRALTLIKLMLKEKDQTRITSLVRDFFGNSQFARTSIENGQAQSALEALRLLNQNASRFRFNEYRREEICSEYLWLASELDCLPTELQVWNRSTEVGVEQRLMKTRIQRALADAKGSLGTVDQLDTTTKNKLKTQLLIEQHRWQDLSDLYWTKDRMDISELDVPDLLSGLTFHRLAGDNERFDADLRVLFRFSDPLIDEFALEPGVGLFEKVNNSTLFMICEFLFTNQQIDKALEYLAKIDRFKAFDAYVSIDEYENAFRALGFAEITSATAKIFDRQIRSYRPLRWPDSTEDIDKLSNVVYAYYQLGFYDEAKSLYRTLYSVATRYEANQTGALSAVCKSILANDQKALFFELIESQLQQKNTEFAIESLFGSMQSQVDGVSLASFWWTVFETEFSERKPIERIKLLDKYLRPLLPDEKPAPEFQAIVKKIERDFENEQGSWGDEAFLGYTYLLWNDRDKAKSWLSKYDFESSPNSDVAMDLGNLYFEDKQHDLAANAYIKAWRFGDRKATGLYFAGLAQKAAGKKELSNETIALAKKMMLKSEDNRDVATYLIDRNRESEARPLLEQAMKVGEMQSWEVGTARFRFINLLKEKDGIRAANLLENQLLDVVATSRYYPSLSSYTYYPMEIHLRLFDLHVLNNSPDLAFEAARKALEIRPCSATVAEDYLPKLRKLEGGKDFADTLFENIRSAHIQRLKKFPNSGLYNNNLAWINSTNKMHLQEALKHAELAVKNEPDNPTYMDTLADVCFNLGQVDRAIALMRKCLRLNPRSEHYNDQLKRFLKKKSDSSK